MNQQTLSDYFSIFSALYVTSSIGSPYVQLQIGYFLQETLDKLPVEEDYFRSSIYSRCAELSHVNYTIYKHQNIIG